jgi:hypothetical protein
VARFAVALLILDGAEPQARVVHRTGSMITRDSSFAPFLAVLALLGCNASGDTSRDLADPIYINKVPTGTIQTPSLCDRVEIDGAVTDVSVDSFAFAWTVDHYQVVYTDLATHTLYALRLSDSGVPLESPQVVAPGGSGASLPFILPTSTGYTVAWEETTTPARTRVTTLGTTGIPSGNIQVVATARGTQMRPVLAPSPTGTAVAWMDQVASSAASTTEVGVSTTYVGLLDDALHVRTDVPVQQIDSALSTGYPWLAGDSQSLALLWSEQISASAIDTYFSFLGGTLAPTSPIDARNAPGATSSALLGRMLGTDFGYFITWEDSRSGSTEVYMSLLQSGGKIYAGGLVEEPGTGSANWPHMAWTGSSLAVVYYQFRDRNPQVFMTFLDENGERLGGAADAQVSDTTEWARYPDVQWTGSEFGVLWIDARNGQPELYFNRVSCRRPAPI